MNDARCAAQGVVQECRVKDRAFDQVHTIESVEVPSRSGGQVVDGHDLVIEAEEMPYKIGADEACPSCNDNPHF